jgi:hypothetical protein
MPKIYTANDLIRFIYQETSTRENLEIQQEIEQFPYAAEELEGVQSILSQLDEIDLEPDPTSVKLILEYSQKLHEPAH